MPFKEISLEATVVFLVLDNEAVNPWEIEWKTVMNVKKIEFCIFVYKSDWGIKLNSFYFVKVNFPTHNIVG